MKRAAIIAEGRKQRVGYRDLVPMDDPYTLHLKPYTLHLTLGLLAVLVLVVLALVSIPTAAAAAAVSHDAQAGYITSIDIIASSRTEHWQGYYGSLAGIPPNATEYPEYFNTSAPNVSSIRPIELGISSFAPGEYLLITDSDSLHLSSLQAGDTSMIDSITGTGYDSGTNTFNDISTFYNIPVRGNIPNVPTVYINGTGLMSFREGLLRDGNNSVFIAPIEVAMPGYNETPCNFQFVLPTNYSCPITYYMYYLSVTVSPSTISLTAYPEVIEANGIDTSTITAFVTDEFGRGVNGTEVTFSTTLGTIEPHKNETTTNGIATTTITSSTSPGTTVVTGSTTIDGSFVTDTVLVAFINTTVATADNETEIGLKQTYTSSDARVGTIESRIDVVFNKLLRNVRLEMSLFDDPDFIDSELKDTIADELEAVFGLDDISASDAENRTPVVINATLSAENLTKEDVKEVLIEITIGKEWFKDVAQENVNNLRIFKINVTTGKVEPGDVTILAETATTVTFQTTFDHFCVFALVARPPIAVAPTAVIHRGARRTPTPIPIPPVPRDTTAPIISNITVTIERYVIISWDTNEKSDSLVKCGMKSGQYTIEEHLPKYVLSHVITLKQILLKNIYENTTYYFVVNSTDPSGNSAQTEEYMFVLTPPEKRAIIPFILQIPITLYTHMWWLLPTTILVLVITAILMPRYKSRRNFNSLVGKPVGTEILMYLYTTFPNVSRPADISKNTNVNLNGVLETLHTISNKNRLESLLGIGLVDKVEYEGEVCYYISKRGKSLMDGLK